MIESGTLCLMLPLFILVVIIRKILQKLTRNSKESKFTRALRIPVQYSVIIVRFFLEGCFGLGIAAFFDIKSIEKF